MDDLAVRLRRTAEAARRSAELNKGDRESRDAAINAAEAAGWTLRAIANTTGLSLSHVQKICYESTIKAQTA